MKVTLLGDSIRLLGYGKRTEELLKEDFEVYQPENNCQYAQFTMRLLYDQKTQMAGTDIFHWNNGLWDTVDYFGDGPFSSAETYVETMVRLARLLKQDGATVIFATTTPTFRHHQWDNAVIADYNRRVVPALQKEGVLINDLYSFVDPHKEEYIREDHVHLSEVGTEACAQEVAGFIREVAKNLK